MSAITASVNCLWKAFYERRPNLPGPTPSMMEESRHKGPIRLEETAQLHQCQEAPVLNGASDRQEPSVMQHPVRRVWRLNSETEIPLDEPCERRVSPKLDLRIPPRRNRTLIRTEVTPHGYTEVTTRDQSKDNRERRTFPRRGRDSSHRRPVQKEAPRQFYDSEWNPRSQPPDVPETEQLAMIDVVSGMMTNLTERRNTPDQSARARDVLAAVLADAATMVHPQVTMMMRTVPMTTDAEDGTVGRVAPDDEMILRPYVTTDLAMEIPLQKKTIPQRPQVPGITASSYRNSTEQDHGNLGGPTSRTVLPTTVGQSTTSWLS